MNAASWSTRGMCRAFIGVLVCCGAWSSAVLCCAVLCYPHAQDGLGGIRAFGNGEAALELG